MKKLICIIAGLTALCFMMSCAPKVYIIDQHTIMEKESAGEWPEFEKEMSKKQSKMGPIFFQKDLKNKKKKRALNVLNGEMKTR